MKNLNVSLQSTERIVLVDITLTARLTALSTVYCLLLLVNTVLSFIINCDLELLELGIFRRP